MVLGYFRGYALLMVPFYKKCLLALVFISIAFFSTAEAQCIAPTQAAPYSENFENNNGNWVPGGTASEWSWGTPIKTVINGAASGSKCWITGTLTQSSYSNNQNSTLTSPCFNFSGLSNPFIRFSVFWETERKYDGATLQYSVNGGNTWQMLGAHADFTSCPTSNWFNTTSITALGSDGWSGNIQSNAPCPGGAGSGSGQWVTAQKSIAFLGGQTNVRFRFRFAAGSVCNNYDGFAVDDIWIGEALPSNADFNYDCGNSNMVNFTSIPTVCNPSYSWNFGDPASGASNISTLSNPEHFYSDPGEYTVTLIVSSSQSAPISIQKKLKILEVSIVLEQPVLCHGDNIGRIKATVFPAGNYSYSWNTNPQQFTPTLNNLLTGTYTVTVSGDQACRSSETITLTSPPILQIVDIVNHPTCGKQNGRIEVQLSGGTPGYSFLWYTVPGDSILTGLGPGSYNLFVHDQLGCGSAYDIILFDQNPVQLDLGEDTLVCNGTGFTLSPGNFQSYKWQDGSVLPEFNVPETGMYSVTVGNGDGCFASDSVFIKFGCAELFFPNAMTPNKDGKNESFGALGDLAAVQNYLLEIFDRWGQKVFTTTDPAKKWDGRINGKMHS
ncbi:MAG: gliding motility-associated C-terminal domain-containing protein, partial [Flavisolibacter sp.]|nr:gliding motility-associated C-terminal domain-containing protein [Flavisolibacter sp.]